MAGGKAIVEFNDLFKTTGPLILGSASDMVMESLTQTRIVGPRMLRGSPESKVLQGGSYIKAFSMFDHKKTRRAYKPGQRQTWTAPEFVSERRYDWRTYMDHMAWNEAHLLMQGGDFSRMSRKGRFLTYLDYRKALEKRLNVSWYEGMDEDVLAVPDPDMEADNGLIVYSLFFWINEWTNGLFPGTTLKGGVDPATETRWRPEVQGYSAAPANATDWDCFDALERACERTYFRPLPSGEGDRTSGRSVIYTSLDGKVQYSKGLRVSNDHTYTYQDPHAPHPQFDQKDIMYVARFGDAEIYDDGSGGYTKEATAAGTMFRGPRYYGCQHEYLYPVFHTEKSMDFMPIQNAADQPDTFVQPVNQYWNLICESIQRQFVVRPTAHVV